MLAHPVVQRHEIGHGFDDRHCSRQDAGVVAASRFELGFVAIDIDGLLRLQQSRSRLESHPKNNVLPIGYTALHATRSIGSRSHLAFANLERVVVLGSFHKRTRKTATDFEPLGRGQRKHGFGQIRLEAIEYRFAQTNRKVAYPTFDDSANRVALSANVANALESRSRAALLLSADCGYSNSVRFPSDIIKLTSLSGTASSA